MKHQKQCADRNLEFLLLQIAGFLNHQQYLFGLDLNAHILPSIQLIYGPKFMRPLNLTNNRSATQNTLLHFLLYWLFDRDPYLS